MTYYISSRIIIDGNDLTYSLYELKSPKGEGYTKVVKENQKGKSCAANNILAAILTPNSYIPSIPEDNARSDGYTIGWGKEKTLKNAQKGASGSTAEPEDYYSDTQLALYEYFDNWFTAADAGDYWVNTPSSANPSTDTGKTYKTAAEELAKLYKFKVEIIYLKRWDDSSQRLIAVYPSTPEDNEPETTEVNVNKSWNDGNNAYETRNGEILVTLKVGNSKVTSDVDGNSITNPVKLNSQNGWAYTFKNLPLKNSSGNKINYSVEESGTISGYKTDNVVETSENNFNITNTLLTEIIVKKEWKDEDDLDDIRPQSITVTLHTGGVSTGKTVTLNKDNNWTDSFKGLRKYDTNGNEIKYTVVEQLVNNYNTPQYSTKDEENGNKTITITNTHTPYYDGYVEITGKVWLDGAAGKGTNINGVYGTEDKLLEGIKVTLRDKNGKQFDNTSVTYTNSNGEYIIKVNYDNSENVYKLYENAKTVAEKLKTAYVEFEYDGLKYTTVAQANSGDNKSKAKENETTRNKFDVAHQTVTENTLAPEEWTDKTMTAVTKVMPTYSSSKTTRNEVIKYCNGNGTADRTKYDNSTVVEKNKEYTCENCGKTGHTVRTYGVEVTTIPNINLGLFEREQPDVAIFSDLTKVQVTMNGQKYTYLYGVRGTDANNVGLQVKFQNKDTYTYRRPVNPADVAYIQEPANNNALSVVVTYEVKLANLSTTIPVKIHKIKNFFDKEYTLNTTGWTVTGGTDYNQATSGELNMTINPLNESPAIELEYTVSMDAILNLINEEATLNNAVEIMSYSSTYGAQTLYAEQRTGGKNGNPYGGYDYNSHPGNAGIFINADGRLEATRLEDDTDIAPSFVLYKSDSYLKTLAGTVWEEVNAKEGTGERVGNGRYDSSTEENVKNVKVELFNLDGTRTKLYNKDTKALDIDAKVYTDAAGNYSLEGAVTGEYFLRFTYGNNTDVKTIVNGAEEIELQNKTKINDRVRVVNARDFKSTIINDSKIKEIMSKNYGDAGYDEKWHITHQDGYSVAVDNMKDRAGISELTYTTFEIGENMTAYTKPFKAQVEFEVTGQAQVNVDGYISGVTNKLDKLDFGIIERPREDLFVQKTITNFKITLANGQILTEGNPSDPNANIPYAKIMGLKESATAAEARQSLEKQVLIEMDTELIQGAVLDVEYAVKVINNNEIDYDYGNITDYTDIETGIIPGQCDKYITKNSKANYYYYGQSSGLNEIKATIEFVDYLDNSLVYKEDTTKWVEVNSDDLLTNGLIGTDVNSVLANNQYKVLQNATGAAITLARNENFSQDMKATKLLANQDENVFDNNAEIIKIDGKTGRVVKAKDALGNQIIYRPGNYVPSLNAGTFEHDDDRVKIIITPPTGLTNNIVTYIFVALIGLVIVFIGVVFIKKRVLDK